MRRLLIAMVIAGSLVAVASAGPPPTGRTLHADLFFRVECPQPPDELAQQALETSLFAAGFDVLNVSRLAQQKHAPYRIPLKIEAMDGDALLDLMSTAPIPGTEPERQGRFSMSVGLYTTPPTRPDPDLEARIVEIATQAPGCSARGIEHGANGPESGEAYRGIVEVEESRFKDAQTLSPTSDAVRMH